MWMLVLTVLLQTNPQKTQQKDIKQELEETLQSQQELKEKLEQAQQKQEKALKDAYSILEYYFFNEKYEEANRMMPVIRDLAPGDPKSYMYRITWLAKSGYNLIENNEKLLEERKKKWSRWKKEKDEEKRKEIKKEIDRLTLEITKKNSEAINKISAFVKEFHYELEKGIEKAYILIDNNESVDDALGYFYAGYFHGFNAGVLYRLEGKGKEASKELIVARTMLKQSLTTDPNLYDAHLPLGSINYEIGKKIYGFTDLVKIVSWATRGRIPSGDKEKGIEQMEKAMKSENENISLMAKFYWIKILEDEKRYKEALLLLKEVIKLYPHNIGIQKREKRIKEILEKQNRDN